MKMRTLRQSHRIGMLAVAMLTTLSVWAQRSPGVGNVAGAVTEPNGPALTKNPAPDTAGFRNKLVMTPFERVIAPHLRQALGKTAANGAITSLPSKATPANHGVGGTNINFPGFVAAPFITLNNGTNGSLGGNLNTEIYASVAADFNNDGYPDIATIQSNGIVDVILNPGPGKNFATATPLASNASATNNNPYIVWAIAADMNNDGKIDLVAQDGANSQIVIWQGNGDGTFGSPSAFTVPNANWLSRGGSVLVGDFNGDGAEDIATLSFIAPTTAQTTQVAIQTFLNKGDGSGNLAASPITTTATFNDTYYAFYANGAVVSNDGKSTSGIAFMLVDSGVSTPANAGWDVLYVASNGDGTFTTPVEPTQPVTTSEGCVSGDYGTFRATNLNAASSSSEQTGGGQPTADLVFMTGDGAVYDVPYTAGSGSFAASSANTLVGASQYAKTLGRGQGNTVYPIRNEEFLNIADMNGDGLEDLIVYGSANVYIYSNAGAATFPSAPIQLVGGMGVEQPQPEDFNSTGYNSFVWVDSSQGQIGFYENMGASSQGTAGQFFAAPSVAGASTNGGANYNSVGGNIFVQATADVDGDGLQDVVAYDYSNSVSNNGYPDIVLGINNGKSTTANELGTFTFKTAVPASFVSGMKLSFVEPVTVNSPSGTSILLATNNGLYISTAASNGVFNAPTALNLGVTLACAPGYADVGDVNGDGILDIVLPYGGDSNCGPGATPSGYFTLLGTQGGGFGAATFTSFGSELYQARLISFSGTGGSLDLAVDDVGFGTGVFGLYAMPNKQDGTGTFSTSNVVSLAANYVIGDIIPGDYNADGKQDLTLTIEGQFDPDMGELNFVQAAMLIPGQGNFAFGAPNLVSVDPGSTITWGSYADFNGDGFLDLALIEEPASSSASPIVQILPNLGGGNFGPVVTEMASLFQPTVYAAYTFTGTFGNTGAPDLLVSGSYNTAVFLNQGGDTLALKASAATADEGQNITLTGNVSQVVSSIYPATGIVSFFDNGSLIGVAEVSGGSASITTDQLSVGSHTLTASYAGDSHFNAASAATSVSVAVTAQPPDFSLSTPSQASLSLTQGATGIATVSVASNSTFSGTVSFTCSGVPSAASCTINPASLTLAPNQTSVVSVIIATTPKNNQYQANNRTPWMKAMGGMSLAGLLLFVIPRRRRLFNRLMMLAVALLSLGSIATLSGCGSGNKYPGTPTGTSTITVTATSGSITQTATIALTVTQAK